MKINRYKMKSDTTFDELREYGFRDGGTWIQEDTVLFKTIPLCDSIELNIGISAKREWDDFADILILDDDFCQPFTPFYGDNYGKDGTIKFLNKVIEKYNEKLDQLSFLIKI